MLTALMFVSALQRHSPPRLLLSPFRDLLPFPFPFPLHLTFAGLARYRVFALTRNRPLSLTVFSVRTAFSAGFTFGGTAVRK